MPQHSVHHIFGMRPFQKSCRQVSIDSRLEIGSKVSPMRFSGIDDEFSSLFAPLASFSSKASIQSNGLANWHALIFFTMQNQNGDRHSIHSVNGTQLPTRSIPRISLGNGLLSSLIYQETGKPRNRDISSPLVPEIPIP